MVKRKRDPRSRESTLSPPPESPPPPSSELKHDADAPTLPELAQYRLPLHPGEVYYIPDFLSIDKADSAYAALLALDTWEHPVLRVYGREVRQSRASTVYATDTNVQMKYSGIEVAVRAPMPPIVEEIRKDVERLVGHVGVCALNLYPGGEVYIGKHSDTADNDVIASLSVGAERTFVFSPREPRGMKGKASGRKKESLRFKLANGSLVIMAGRTQEFWKHEIPKEKKVTEGRISLTYRRLKSHKAS